MNLSRRSFFQGAMATLAIVATPAVLVARKLGWVNVKDFGAVGDGVAYDGPALRAASEALENGGTLYIPPGVYRVGGSDLSHFGARVIVTGAGVGATQIEYDKSEERPLAL